MNSSQNFDDDAVVAVASLTADAVASRLDAVRERLPSLLPDRCLREIDGDDDETPKLELEERARERLVTCEAALAALGQSSRSLCDQQDELNRLHNHFVHETCRHERDGQIARADRVARRLRGLAWQPDGELSGLLGRLTLARMLGLRSVLRAQLDRQFYTRNGRPIPADAELPVGSGGRGDPELELVPLELKDPEDPEDGAKGGGSGSGGAAPAVAVMATDFSIPDADVDADDEDENDGLDLDLDRKA